ncbi:hypothetical protein [Crateriforma spongiae]|uniref:hypothetical protein n=1 Tax=Crateriforma spongiae TaxID=2724528 RepID=UPI0014450892|nr:hypothetical protein [Crateriforma spongiae]
MKFSIRSLLIAVFVAAVTISGSHTIAINLDHRIERLEQLRRSASRRVRDADHWLESLERFTSFSDARVNGSLPMIAEGANIDINKGATQQAFTLMSRKQLAELERRQLDQKIEQLSRIRRCLPTIPIRNHIRSP